MAAEADEDLIVALLRREAPLTADRKRRAMRALGNMLVSASGADFDACTVNDVAQIDGWICYMLGELLLDSEVTVTEAVHSRDVNIAADVSWLTREDGVKWRSAIYEVGERYRVSRAVVTRAWAKHKTGFARVTNKWRR